jgi:hypothetical protein
MLRETASAEGRSPTKEATRSRVRHGHRSARIARLGACVAAALTLGGGVAAVPSPAGGAEPAATSANRPPLFFSRLTTTGFQIHVEDQAGTVTALTTADTNDRDPSPMAGNGAQRRTVIADPEANLREPSLSPDGTTILFTRQSGDDEQVYVVHTDGSGLRRLSHDGGTSRQPRWSPDGRWIAFVHSVGSIEDIDKMGAGGGTLTG